MSAPLVWIFLPLAAAAGLWFIRHKETLTAIIGVMFCLLLAGVAAVAPLGTFTRLGPIYWDLPGTFSIAGRQFELLAEDRSLIILIYMLGAIWFAACRTAGGNRYVIPNGLAVLALLVASLAVRPFLYAALLIEMAVLISIPLLAPPGRPWTTGVQRYLIFQTLALPFILLAGWGLGRIEAEPNNTQIVLQTSLLLGLGFSFWLAVFPFYTWMPALAEQTPIYEAAFIFLVFPIAVLLLVLKFLDGFIWLRSLADLYPFFRVVGALMIATAGIWMAFQHDLSRSLGYAVIIETGFSLMALGLASQAGLFLSVQLFLPRIIEIALWALSLSVLQKAGGSYRLKDLNNLVRKYPFASVGLAVASFSMAGLPLMAEFPVRLTLLQQVAQISLPAALTALAGCVGFFFSTFRTLAALAGSDSSAWEMHESWWQAGLILISVVALLLIGLFPSAFYPLMNNLLRAFPHLIQ